MIFEGRDLRVILPLDPSQGERYIEPLRLEDQDDVEPIYTITVQEEGSEDPPAAGWESGSSCNTDSEDDLESWQNYLHEPHGCRHARTTKSLRWLNSQPNTLPIFDGLTDPEPFIAQVSGLIPESQTLEALDSAFRATAARWWRAHKV